MTTGVTPRRPFRALVGLAWRESRTARRRLLLYMSSIALGVAALVAIDSFAENVTDSVHEQSRALLGGDVALSSNDPYGASTRALLDSMRKAGVRESRQTTFASMALVPRSGATRLAQVRAVTPAYPIYGVITTQPASAWGTLARGRYAVVDPSLLVSLAARIGDTLAIGASRFVITGTIENVPGDAGIGAAIGPRVYIPEQYIAETGLLVFGSRAQYETLLQFPPNVTAQQFQSRFRARLSRERVRIRTAAQNEYNLTQAIDQLRDFLSIIGLIALLLGGIGVGSGVHAFVMRKIDTVAVLRCLGATSWQVLAIYVTQAAAMGLVGAVAGAVLGIGIQFLVPAVATDFLPVDVSVRLAPGAIALGLGVGTWVALVFALRPLVALRRVSPLQALRRESDADALRASRGDPLRLLVTLAIVGSVLALALSRGGGVRRGIAFSVAIGVAIGVLWLAAAGLSWIARRAVRPRWAFTLRQGVASLYRPGNQTRSVVLALGFGVFLMTTVYQVQHSLLGTLDLRLSQARANLVFFDIQGDQEPGVDSLIRRDGFAVNSVTPIIPMRIASINGKTVSELMRDTARATRGRAGWPLRREYRSTYRADPTASEKIVEGRWFARNSDTTRIPEVSVERDVANELHLRLGDTITWNVQGVNIPTRVTSFREVNWARFEPNFFVVFEPRALAGAPKQFAVLARVPTAEQVARVQRDVVTRYPNVSSLDLTLVQHTIANVLDKVTVAIRFLALVSLALAVPVLFSAVAATRRGRVREAVLLKTLGATRRQIGRIMLAEYALLGALGALVGVILSSGAAWALCHWIFDVRFVPAVGPIVLVGAGMVGLAVAIGLLTGREVFSQTPMVALREA